MALVEPLSPIVNITSNSVVEFNQTSVSNVLSLAYEIRSLNAVVSSAALEWRRGDSGSWSVLSDSYDIGTFTHQFIDSNFNDSPFNYRYTVTDTVGGTSTDYVTITPVAYELPTVTISVTAAASLTNPETNLVREKGNYSSYFRTSIINNNPYVDLLEFSIVCSAKTSNEEVSDWITLYTSDSLDPNGIPAPSFHEFYHQEGDQEFSSYPSSVRYMVVVSDSYSCPECPAGQSTYSQTIEVQFKHLIFYGASSSSINSGSAIRSLPNRIFTSGPNPFTLMTGNSDTYFHVAMPNDLSITSVTDLDALNANIKGNYSETSLGVPDFAGTSRPYKVYVMSIASPYDSTHRHQISRA
jgi:hypothetical protein